MKKSNKTNIYDLATQAGVSPATVSRVLNRRGNVSEATCQRVKKLAAKLGYTAQVLTARNHLPLIVEDPENGMKLNGYDTQMIAHVCNACTQHGMMVEIIPARSMALLAMTRAHAAICITYHADTADALGRLGFPLVSINNPIPHASNISSDHRGGMEMAVQHLHQMGHTRIGMACSDYSSWGNLQRIEGYHQAVKQLQLEADDLLVRNIHSDESLLESILKLIRLNVTAIIVSGEEMGLRAQHALDLAGKQTAKEISLITYEDPLVSAYTSPPQTTIAQPFQMLAEAAVTCALAQYQKPNRKPQPSVVLGNTLIIRESVARLI